jgi:tetratricopeptide (TPR) repeat protein
VSEDWTVRLWSLSNPTAELRVVLRGHEGPVYGVAYGPGGQVLATASRDQTVRLWSLETADLIRIACRLTGGNFSYQDWQKYHGDKSYIKTCPLRPLHPSFLEEIRKQVKKGDVKGGIAKLYRSLQVDGDADLFLDKEARRLAAPGLVDKGRELARQGAIREAIAAFAAAQASDPNLEIPADAWNSLCWQGSLADFATDVMVACERAVALKPEDGGIRESHGVARALTGDYSGAIEDFQQYLEWAPKHGRPGEEILRRQDWIRMLSANQNPFNKELLQRLRNQ